MRVTLIYNPTSGDETHDGDSLRALLEAAGHDVRAQSVKEDGWKQLLSEPGELVVAAGGDGTVRKVFKELATSATPVTVLPLGSANNIARTLRLADEDPVRLIAELEHAPRTPFDLAEVSAAWGATRFVESFGGGVFAEVLARADEVDTDEDKVTRGLRLLGDALRDAPVLDWRVDADGIDLSGAFLAVEAVNVPETSANIPLAPAADHGDGLLDLVRVGAGDRASLLAYVEDRLEGRNPAAPPLPVVRAGRIVMGPPAESLLRVDDELWPEDGPHDGETVVVSTGALALDVLVPTPKV